MVTFIRANILTIFMMCFSNTVMADLDFFSHLLLSNKKYDKYIIVRSAVVAEDEVMDFFNSTSFPNEQRRNRELYGKKLFLLVQCKNIGDYRAFGEMRFKVQGRNFLVPVHCASLLGNMENFSNCAVIYLGSGIVSDDDNSIKITYFWKNLYTI